MKSARFLSQVRTAIQHLNPHDIHARAERPLRVLLQATGGSSYAAVEDYLCPTRLSRERRMETARTLVRDCDPEAAGRFHLVFYESGTLPPEGWMPGEDAFCFQTRRLDRMVKEVIDKRDDLALALARWFPPFRDEFARRTVHQVARENALFSLLTALPDVVPGLSSIPWAVGEFASDTAVLTANQIRMAFLLAAASDREVGYREQRSQIGSIIAGAWGWRAAARQLAGKIPFGGGLIPKATIAFAGTYVVGLSLERYYRIGYGLTRQERREAYEGALVEGRKIAAGLLDRVRSGGATQ